MSDLINENDNLIEESPKNEEIKPVETSTEDTTKDIVENPQTVSEVITAIVSGGENKLYGLTDVNGAIGSAPMVVKPAKPEIKKEKKAKAETVAIHSTKNVTWPGVGKVYVGYNIVNKPESEQWLTRSHIRLATPEEVAKEFGKL